MRASTSLRILTDGRLDTLFARDGFVITDALSSAEVAMLLEVFDTFASHHARGFSATMLSADIAYRAAAHAALAQVIAPALATLLDGYRPVCCGFAVKQPGLADGAMPMHQDITMVPRLGRSGLSVWIPLVDVGVDNGCLQVVPRSHHCDIGPRAPGTPFVLRGREAELRASHLLALPMTAGQALVMHPALFHASDVNRTLAPRPVVAAPFVPEEAPLLYYQRRVEGDAAWLDRFDVDDAFYLTHRLGMAPAHAQPTQTVREASIADAPAAATAWI